MLVVTIVRDSQKRKSCTKEMVCQVTGISGVSGVAPQDDENKDDGIQVHKKGKRKRVVTSS
jgi:hypothetical protein